MQQRLVGLVVTMQKHFRALGTDIIQGLTAMIRQENISFDDTN